MGMTMTPETKKATLGLLNDAIRDASGLLSKATMRKRDFESLLENNDFPSLEEAESWLEERLHEYACEDCEGSYNCGIDEYKQRFTVAGVLYKATLRVDYNRHDKRYYYTDGVTLKVAAVPADASAEAAAP
jgi:hypothetical protein